MDGHLGNTADGGFGFGFGLESLGYGGWGFIGFEVWGLGFRPLGFECTGLGGCSRGERG